MSVSNHRVDMYINRSRQMFGHRRRSSFLIVAQILFTLIVSPLSAQNDACTSSGLVCNNNLQISIKYDCTLQPDIDRFLENPIEGQEYTLEFFDHHKRPIEEISESHVGTTVLYSVSCGGNSCSGQAIIESNHLPVFDAPCQVREGGPIPLECRTWCGTDIPSIFLTLDDIHSDITDMCIPNILGDIKQTLIREGDICSPDGETVTLIHEAKILTHGTLKNVELLRQSVIQLKIDLNADGPDSTSSIVYPETLHLNCDEGYMPEEILKTHKNYTSAYPIYLDKHNPVPDSLYQCDTFILETIIGFRDTVIAVDTIDGELIWEKLTVIDKEFEDSIVCAIQPVLNPDSTAVLVPNKVLLQKRLCNLIASFSDTEYNACGSGKKIIRQWTVIDWCDANIEHTESQIIEVTDKEKPIILEEITEMDIILEPWSCSATAKLPAIIAEDNCGEVKVKWHTDEGVIEGALITDLWFDNSPVELMALVGDECNNIDTMIINLNIVDDTPPVAICNTSMQIVLTADSALDFDNGTAKLWAEDFDEGSHDSQCGKVEFFVVRQEDWTIPVENCGGEFIGYSPQSCSAKTEIVDLGELKSKQCEYTGKNRRPFVTKPAEFIKFCCEDANKLIDVIFIAKDKAGNTNECLVTILVKNTNGPELLCEDALITCEEDVHSVKGPELIDGDVCPVSFLPVEYISDFVDRSNCDSIVLMREWYVDANSDGAYGVGDPHCTQNITIVGADDEVEFICQDLELSCTISIDSLPKPAIAGNEFCICDEDLIKVSSFRYADNSCQQDTLIVEWYYDYDANGLPSTNESSCTQRIALVTDPSSFNIDCQDVSVSCARPLSEAARPTLTGQGDHCLCPEDFIKTEFVGQGQDKCIGETIQRSWYIDFNLNNRKDEDESGCLQNITIDYSEVNYSLSCTDMELNCNDDPDLNFAEPEILSNEICECPDPLIFLLEETRVNNVCGIDTITRKWFLDVNGNETYEIEEPKCAQYITINNAPAPVSITCEDATISCLDQLSSLFIPIIENPNTCGCTSNQLELRSQTSLDGLCYGDVITREWYVDLDGDTNYDSNEPLCIQNLTLDVPVNNPAQNEMSFDCSTLSVACTDNLDNLAAPLLFSEGICQCDEISVNMLSQSAIANVCVGDTIFREWYADLNQNNSYDSTEPYCNQALIIVGSQMSTIVCTDEVINCSTQLNQIPAPRVESAGFCSCTQIQPSLLSESSIDNLCIGDNITRMWYVDINMDGVAAEDEPFCQQTISIQGAFPGNIENCGTLSISCSTDLTTLVPTVNVGAGICSCEEGVNLVAESVSIPDSICFNDTIERSWFIDVNNNGTRDADEEVCNQTLIVDVRDSISLMCTDYTVSCLESNPPLLAPSIESSSCNCSDVQVLLLNEFGAEDGCVGDTLFREWYADVNGNSMRDQDESTCIQHLILADDNAFVNFECVAQVITCTTDLESLPVPNVVIESACGCMEFSPILFRDGLSDSLCVGDTTSRMWYIDLDGDSFADEDEPYCLQSFTIIAGGLSGGNMSSDTMSISCSTDLDSIMPDLVLNQGICQCESEGTFVLSDGGATEYCINDTIKREWFIDTNNNQIQDSAESQFLQVFVVDASDNNIGIVCLDQFVDCQFDQVPAQLPIVATADGCTCPDIQVLILRQFGAEERCVGDTLFREWFADVNANNNFDPSEPLCIQNIILQDNDAQISFNCESVSISCQTVADSIPTPSLNIESACGCMDFEPTLLSDGSLAGICFGESFIREWFIDSNNDNVPQADEASCRQVVMVDGSMSEMTFNCESLNISCLDTLSQIAPPLINTVGICTCNQFDLSIAEVIIDGSICVGDTIIQRWFVDSNPNNQFDSLDVSCDQILVLQGDTQTDFLCEEVMMACDGDFDLVPPPAILGEGLCSCTDLPRIMTSQSDTTGQKCIGDEIVRQWFLDINLNDVQDDTEPVCEQVIILTSDSQSGGIEFINCDTLSISCTTDLTSLVMPEVQLGGECVCDSIVVLPVNVLDSSSICTGDTLNREFFADTNGNGMFNIGEPSCSQVILVDDSVAPFDPLTIKWPTSFTGDAILGVNVLCENDSISEEELFILTGDPFNCMPEALDSRPVWCESECGLISYSVARDTTESLDACFRIRNVFTLIDWCTFDPAVTDTLESDPDVFQIVKDLNSGSCSDCSTGDVAIQDSVYFRYSSVDIDGVYRYVQEIRVEDDEPPFITVMQDTVRVNVSELDSTMSCQASVNVSAQAMDFCNGEETAVEMIQWTIRVVDEERNPILAEDGRNIETATGATAMINSRLGMPGDTFSVVWTVRDGCNTASIRETQVIFFDSTGTCDTMSGSAGIIAGHLKTETGETIQDAMVTLRMSEWSDPQDDMSDENGMFAFYNNPMHMNYNIHAEKEDAYGNGVSTADLILIYNHINGEEYLNSPYKIIAADATNDKSISISDITEIKKIILQSEYAFADNQSWRFVDEQQIFFDEQIPWPFTEINQIVDLHTDMMQENFIGIKIGDVNGDVILDPLQTEIRNNSIFELQSPDKFIAAHSHVRIPIRMSHITDVQGFQATIELYHAQLVTIESGLFAITEDDFHQMLDGFTISSHSINDLDTDVLFTLVLQTDKSKTISDLFALSSSKTKAEIYIGPDFDLRLPVLSFTEVLSESFHVTQNKPNPFKHQTVIDFEIPEQGTVHFTVYNSSGAKVLQRSQAFPKGQNSLSIQSADLKTAGLFLYALEYRGKRVSHQMLIVE